MTDLQAQQRQYAFEHFEAARLVIGIEFDGADSAESALAFAQEASGLWQEGISALLASSDVIPPLYREAYLIGETLDSLVSFLVDDEDLPEGFLDSLYTALAEVTDEASPVAGRACGACGLYLERGEDPAIYAAHGEVCDLNPKWEQPGKYCRHGVSLAEDCEPCERMMFDTLNLIKAHPERKYADPPRRYL